MTDDHPVVRRGLRGLGDRTPLRVRLTVLLLVLVALGLLAAGAAATSQLNGYLLGREDDQLVEQASRPRIPADDVRPRRGQGRERSDAPGRFYIALLAADGTELVVPSRPGGRGDEQPDLSGLTLAEAQRRGRAPFTVSSADGTGQWRVVLRETSVQLVPRARVVAYATDLGDVRGTTSRLLALQLALGAVVLVLLGGAGYVLVRRSLTPLVEVEEAAAAVAAGDLTRRVPERDPRTEVGSLSRSFNEMVEQVQSAFATRAASEERLRRFAADASHELRTPLTSIRGFAELYRQGASDDVARLMSRIEDESRRMGLLVEDLLMLARMDQQRPLDRAPVDLRDLAADAVHDARALSPERLVSLEAPATPVVVPADEGRLRQVLANLVGNALVHTPETASITVRVALSPDGREALLEVRDAGPGMSAEDAALVFERFFRADASRTRASGGSGLGLSIVSALVEAHGGRVELDTAPGRGSTFRVLLPVG